MQTPTKIYADGIGEIHFLNGMIRLDLVTLEAPAKESGAQPQSEACAQIIMSPQGFLASFAAMQQLADKLAEAGLIQKAPR